MAINIASTVDRTSSTRVRAHRKVKAIVPQHVGELAHVATALETTRGLIVLSGTTGRRMPTPDQGIDSSPLLAERSRVKRWLSLLLLAGALLGLMGQEAAFAHVVPVQTVTVTAMSPDCAQMMGITKQVPQPAMPCEGMTPDCVAKMGCAVPLALVPPVASDAAREFRAMLPSVAPATPLVGRNFGPEPEPPSRLG